MQLYFNRGHKKYFIVLGKYLFLVHIADTEDAGTFYRPGALLFLCLSNSLTFVLVVSIGNPCFHLSYVSILKCLKVPYHHLRQVGIKDFKQIAWIRSYYLSTYQFSVMLFLRYVNYLIAMCFLIACVSFLGPISSFLSVLFCIPPSRFLHWRWDSFSIFVFFSHLDFYVLITLVRFLFFDAHINPMLLVLRPEWFPLYTGDVLDCWF